MKAVHSMSGKQVEALAAEILETVAGKLNAGQDARLRQKGAHAQRRNGYNGRNDERLFYEP